MNEEDQDLILCCDWGTSNFRLYLVTISTSSIIKIRSTDRGISDVSRDYHLQDSIDRPAFFADYLYQQIEALGAVIVQDLSAIPVVLSGMASSSIGMIEVPYDKVPFSLTRPVLNYNLLTSVGNCKNDLFVFGGLQCHADVMRGEEIEIIGLREVIDTSNCMCILPGTHAKHIRIQDGAIQDFKTYMTGEIFSLMSKQSILQHSVEAPVTLTIEGEEQFRRGVTIGAQENLLNSLFGIRTNDILEGMKSDDNYLKLSGQLIGHELKSLMSFDGQIYIAGGGMLAPFYSMAIDELGLADRTIIVREEDMSNVIPHAHVSLFNNLELNQSN